MNVHSGQKNGFKSPNAIILERSFWRVGFVFRRAIILGRSFWRARFVFHRAIILGRSFWRARFTVFEKLLLFSFFNGMRVLTVNNHTVWTDYWLYMRDHSGTIILACTFFLPAARSFWGDHSRVSNFRRDHSQTIILACDHSRVQRLYSGRVCRTGSVTIVL